MSSEANGISPPPATPHAKGAEGAPGSKRGCPSKAPEARRLGTAEGGTRQTLGLIAASSIAGLTSSHRCCLGDSVRLEARSGGQSLGTAGPFLLWPRPGCPVGCGSVCRVPWGGVSSGHELGFAEAAAGSSCEVPRSRPWSSLFPSPVPLAGIGPSGVFTSQGQTGTAGTTRTHGPEMATAPSRRQNGTECGDSPGTLHLHSREPQ